MSSQTARLLILSGLVFGLATATACRTTPGAPDEADGYGTGSAAQAMEEEEEQDAWEDANR
jgi:hypothetical protein